MDARLRQLPDARVLVVGDLILDRYWHGDAGRISPEAPVPVVRVKRREERVGGAANVAANIAALGARATLVGVVGADEEGATLARLCADLGIVTDFVRAGGATTVKLRVVSQRQQLLRMDFEDDGGRDAIEQVCAAVARHLDDCEVVVVSDYAKGALGQVEEVIALARAADKAVVVDPKGTDFSRYAGASVITPNLREFEAVAGISADESGLAAQARRLAGELEVQAVLVTRGSAGMTLAMADGDVRHVPADAQEVYDVTGAGDTVCGVLAAALATGCDLREAIGLANAAAGLVVGRFGAATVSCEEIDAALVGRAGMRRGIVDRATLLDECAKARRRGERIIMTNGCFDILHAGHVGYLRQARELGSRLVVAVNDDASVAALKGAGRPLNALPARMQVLAALDAVDWVVPFGGETPRELVAEVLPDVLVKGGDYTADAIAGAAEVRAAGGEVVVLPYQEGHSTTAIIARAACGEEPRS